MKKKNGVFHLDMFILSDLYRVAINVGDRALTPGMKKVIKFRVIESEINC
jgi:hypothetical protein